jgi:uncharacterized membrane protein
MRTPANIAGHPIHPMLVPIPIGLWLFSLICDLIYRFVSQDPAWSTVALYTMVGGIVGALAAAIPGLIDLLSLRPGARNTALLHMGINLTVVLLYVINAFVRVKAGDSQDLPVWLSVVAIALLIVSGWLGGKMVYLQGVAVEAAPESTPTPGRALRT